MAKGFSSIVNEWLGKAESDYLYARSSFETFDNFYSQMCILCHDSAEKYLKAYLIYNGFVPEKIHDLVTLYKQCNRVSESSLESANIENECRILNRYYVPLKYPSHYPAIDKQKAKEAIEAIDIIRGAITSKIAQNRR